MLIAKPKEMFDNPDCYKKIDGVYIPTDSATEREKRAIKKYNEEWEYLRKQERESSDL